MISMLKAAGRTALRCLLDGALWWALVRAALSWVVLARLVGALALLLVGGLAGAMLPHVLRELLNLFLGFVVSLWLEPLAVRRGVAIVVPRAVDSARPESKLPDAGAFRDWWMPLLLANGVAPGLVSSFVEPYDIVDWRLTAIAVFAVQLLAARAALVRSVLAPALPRAAIEATLAARRVEWLLVALGYMVVGALLTVLVRLISGLGDVGVLGLLSALQSHRVLSFLMVRVAIASASFLAVQILCAAALAHVALALAAPGAGVRAPARRAAPASARRVPGRIAVPAALVALLALGLLMRGQLAYWALGGDTFRKTYLDYRDWSDPAARQHARTKLACEGQTAKLRLMTWGGVRGDRSDEDRALGCAAHYGHLETVQALVAAGDDIDRDAAPEVAERGAARLTPLQEAVRTPRGLPVADWLLAHHANPRPAGAAADLVQTAAASNCLPCLEWLHQRGFAMDAQAPATPMTLWLDARSHSNRDELGDLPRLIELGLSPSAVGEDGRSALHAAAAAANGSAVDLLLAQGAAPALADRDGMTPLLYAARGLYQTNSSDSPEDTARRERRIAVITKLIALTPTLDAEGRPARPPHPFVAVNAYIENAEVLGRAADLDAAIRAAAAQAGKTIHYEDASFVAKVPPAEGRAALAAMDDAQFSIVMRPAAWLTGYAQRAGWWPEMARALRTWHGNPGQGFWGECDILAGAVAGTADASPGATESWSVVDAWLDAGLHLSECARGAPEREAAIARRTRAQQADWRARTVGIKATTQP